MKNNKQELYTRSYTVKLETREENGVGIIEGRPIVYESMTDIGPFNEVIERGALDNADLTDVRLCLNHDTSYVYARSRRNNNSNTMQLTADENGLGFRAMLDIKNSPKAQDYYSAVKRGDIDKMSFMFGVADEEWTDLDTEHPTRHIKSISTVIEISAVTFPAYDSTSITARDKSALDNARRVLENARSKSVDTDAEELELEKLKAHYLFNI